MSTTPTSSAFTPSGSTHLAIAEVDRIVVRGKDLCRDVIGQQSFTAYFLFLLTGETPSANLVRVADATMVSLAEHGLVPSNQAARMTFAAAPEAMQGAVAAGLLGAGSVVFGSSEVAGRLFLRVEEEAKQHGGDIHVSSRLGEGSTFVLEFPLRLPAADAGTESDGPLTPPPGSEP